MNQYIMKNSRRIQAKGLFDYNIFLIGFMGTGKSTIASELQAKLEMDRIEMDELIVQKQGMSISEIFDEYGDSETQTDHRLLRRRRGHARRQFRTYEKEWTGRPFDCQT